MRKLVGLFLAVGLLALPSLASAQFINLLGTDLMLQTVKQNDQSAIAGMAFRLRFDSDDLPAGLILMPSVERWKDTDRLDAFRIDSSERDLTFGLDGVFDWTWGSITPYAGAGVGLHFIKTEIFAPSLGVAERKSSRTRLGPNLLLGVNLSSVGLLRTFVEGKYEHVPPFQQFKINVGLGLNL